MADALDAPTVYREGAPVLGVPVLSVQYRSGLGTTTPLAAVLDLLDTYGQRLVALEALATYLAQPWWRRWWSGLRRVPAPRRDLRTS